MSENINTAQYWDVVYREEYGTPKRRIDEERWGHFARELNGLVQERRDEEGTLLSPSLDQVCILDVAGGSGELGRRLLHEYPGIKVTTVDFSPEAIALAQWILQRMDFLVEDAQVLGGIPSNSQDLIFAGEVLEHLDSDESCIRAVMRCLKPGGRGVFTVPYKDRNKSPEHVREYDLNSVRDLAEKYGRVVSLDVAGDYRDWFSIVLVLEKPVPLE